MKKVWKFISSMRFAILLLIVLAIACSIGSLVTQGQDSEWYAQRYSERATAWIMALRLDDAFHSWWFIAITGFLCLNLTLCNLIRLPRLIRAAKADARPENALGGEGDVRTGNVADPRAVFRALRMPSPAECRDAEGREALFAAKNRAGRWGAWVCHLGIMLIILGFGLGQMTQKQYTVYGVPGQAMPVGDTGYVVRIDDFRMDYHEDGSIAQYTSAIAVYAAGDEAPARTAEISVNHPASLFGMKFYQNSTGWAARLKVDKSGRPLQDEILCAGEYLCMADKAELAICLNAVYPDHVVGQDGMPATASNRLNNPACLYSIYYQSQVVGMGVIMPGEPITIDAYEAVFSDVQAYTLIQVKEDHFTWLALLGGLAALAGLVLAFYVQPSKVWAIRTDADAWTVYGQCRKGGALFRDRFMAAAGQKTPESSGKE